MVKRVYGKANNFEVSFTLNPVTERWEAAVPSELDGEFYVELYAEDYAGNTSYLCKVLFIITGHTLKIKVIDDGYKANMDSNEYKANMDRKVGYLIEHIICCRT